MSHIDLPPLLSIPLCDHGPVGRLDSGAVDVRAVDVGDVVLADLAQIELPNTLVRAERAGSSRPSFAQRSLELCLHARSCGDKKRLQKKVRDGLPKFAGEVHGSCLTSFVNMKHTIEGFPNP